MPATLQETITLAETLFARYELDPDEARNTEIDDQIVWEFSHGSAIVALKIYENEDEDEEEDMIVVHVESPILVIPNGGQEALFAHLLSLNMEMVTAAFALRDNQIVVHTGRVAEGMDIDELHEMITDVACFADHFDDILAEQFPHVQMVGQPSDNLQD